MSNENTTPSEGGVRGAGTDGDCTEAAGGGDLRASWAVAGVGNAAAGAVGRCLLCAREAS